jgi:Lar family restriction alleviation protein
MGEKLKPCPFCDSHNISSGESMSTNDSGEFFVQTGCLDCGAYGPEIKDGTDKTADRAWNKRNNDEP